MEWIDDCSAVLVFASPDDSLDGLATLSLDKAFLDTIQNALEALADVYSEQSPEHLAILAQAHLATPISVNGQLKPTWIRIAKVSDKKATNAASKSQYYAERAASRDARLVKPPKRDLASLDAELDAFVAGEDAPAPERRPRNRRDADLDQIDRRRDRRREMEDLDKDLDSYVQGEEIHVKRRRSPSPDRSLNNGVELLSNRDAPSLLQRLSKQPILPDAHVHLQPQPDVQEAIQAIREQANPKEEVLSISPAYSTVIATSKRPTAADLFDDASPRKAKKMFGWVCLLFQQEKCIMTVFAQDD